MATTAERIAERRKTLGLRQEDLAEISDLTQSQISRYEAGTTRPSGPVLKAIARAMNTSVDYLLGTTDDPTITESDLSPDEQALIDAYRSRDIFRIMRLLGNLGSEHGTTTSEDRVLFSNTRPKPSEVG